MKREDAFHAVSKGHLADRERFASATMFLRNADPFKHLDALLVAFPDLHVHLDGIAGSEFRDIRPQLLFFNQIQYIHDFSSLPFILASSLFSAAFLRLRQQIRSISFRLLQRRLPPPFANGFMITRYENFRHLPSPKFYWPRVVRVFDQLRFGCGI